MVRNRSRGKIYKQTDRQAERQVRGWESCLWQEARHIHKERALNQGYGGGSEWGCADALLRAPGHPGVPLGLSLISSLVPWMPAIISASFHCTAHFICLKCSSLRSLQACPHLLHVFTQVTSAQWGGNSLIYHVPISMFPSLVFPCGSAGKESTCNTGDLGLIPSLDRSPGERKGYPLQYSGLENSMGSQRVGHNWATFTSLLVPTTVLYFTSFISSLIAAAESFQSYLSLCNPMDCGPPGSFVHGILQARILKWAAMLSSRGSS